MAPKKIKMPPVEKRVGETCVTVGRNTSTPGVDCTATYSPQTNETAALTKSTEYASACKPADDQFRHDIMACLG